MLIYYVPLLPTEHYYSSKRYKNLALAPIQEGSGERGWLTSISTANTSTTSRKICTWHNFLACQLPCLNYVRRISPCHTLYSFLRKRQYPVEVWRQSANSDPSELETVRHVGYISEMRRVVYTLALARSGMTETSPSRLPGWSQDCQTSTWTTYPHQLV